MVRYLNLPAHAPSRDELLSVMPPTGKARQIRYLLPLRSSPLFRHLLKKEKHGKSPKLARSRSLAG